MSSLFHNKKDKPEITRFTIALVSLFVIVTTFSTQAYAQDSQIAFTVPKPKHVILAAVQNGTIERLLLSVGLDNVLEASFPSTNPSSPTEVTVRIFVKVFGTPVPLFPMQVVRVAGQTWAQALGAASACDTAEPEPGLPGSPGDCNGPTSPILLDLDRNQFHLSGGPVLFDIDADGQLETLTWVAPGTQDAFLFFDRNGNGVVDDGSELFGNATLLISGEQEAQHGYEALAEFDLVENGGNQDGIISDADSIFSDLGVWIDSNANGIHESFESQSLAEAGVLSIGLDYRESRRTDSHGNEFRYIGSGSIEVNGKNKKMATTDVFFRILAQ